MSRWACSISSTSICDSRRASVSLCGRMATVMTSLLGWWGVVGIFWMLQTLFKNAIGGGQPRENNFQLLKAVGYDLYQQGRYSEAYLAFLAALRLKPDAILARAVEQLRSCRDKTFDDATVP